MRASLFASALVLVVASAACSSSNDSSRTTSGSGGGDTSTSTSTSGSGGSSSTSTTTGAGGGGTSPVACPSAGDEITSLPACAAMGSDVDVAPGCIPTVDGTLHADEWQDAHCVDAGGDVLYLKYAGDAVYLAMSGQPACGCGMTFAFDPDGQGAASGDEYSVNVFDDPFNADGDRADFQLQNGMWSPGKAPAGIVTKCPGNQPSPVRYEWKIPLAALGVTPGAAHAFRFAFVHPNGGSWPAGVESNGKIQDPTAWGSIASSSSWK